MTPPTPITLWIAGEDPAFGAVAVAAAPAAFGAAAVVRRISLASPPPATEGPELLLLGQPAAAELAAARATLDVLGLPRWAVVVLGDAPDAGVADSPYVLTRDVWRDTALVARVFRAAIDGHALLRENARLRGDLRTFGHRVAHELRTPLGGVLTTAEMLTEILAHESPAHAGLVAPIVESGEGLVRLIDRMSFFAKAIASDTPPAVVDMGRVFWDAFQQLEGRLLAAGAVLSHPRDWPRVRGHAAWLEAVWRQLIANAVQHGGPAVRIEAGWTPAGAQLRFWLKDSGRIPPERQAALFTPFHLRYSAGAPHGLGLAMVERLVTLDGGRCGFEPVADSASCFWFQLPAEGA